MVTVMVIAGSIKAHRAQPAWLVANHVALTVIKDVLMVNVSMEYALAALQMVVVVTKIVNAKAVYAI